MKKLTRREAIAAGSGLALAGSSLLGPTAAAQTGHDQHGGHTGHAAPAPASPPPAPAGKYSHPVSNTFYARTIAPGTDVPPGEPGKDYTPVVTPSGTTLPYQVVDGVKIYHLVAEPVLHEFAPGL
ncbi:MAG: hypothetical protein AB7G34_08945, partial [Hyphomicrobiales bacterium]